MSKSDEIEMQCEWADYRKHYGVSESAMSEAHKAFVAGWEGARRGTTYESVMS